MKITNKYNLPETIVNVLHRPTYSKGKANLSVTELINSPRIVALKQKHWDEIEQDASEMVWSLFGSAVHSVLEHGRAENHVIEQRLTTEFEGWTISGAIDLQEATPEGIVISDYKVTSAWAVMNEKKEWPWQLNLYAWLVERVKFVKVKTIQIVAIVRDWSAREAKTKEGYPQAPVVVLEMEMWTNEQREEFVRNRLRAHSEARLLNDLAEDLPECTPEEMWERPSMWAVKKEGAARAKSVHSTHEEALNVLGQIKNKTGYSIEHRPGGRTRCASFCPVSGFCSQYQSFKEQE